jgi:hypothetical protein
MEDTSGFYKKFEDESWIHAPNFVYARDYTLEKDGNRESIDGWEWFDNAPQEYLIWKITQEQENVNTN